MGWRTQGAPRMHLVGHKIVGEIIETKGECKWGHEVGDKFRLSLHGSSGLCSQLYNLAYPYICALQFGAKFPAWMNADEQTKFGEASDYMVFKCPDKRNRVTLAIRRYWRQE